jgi:sulfide dehydrogenase cytochrome subunit
MKIKAHTLALSALLIFGASAQAGDLDAIIAECNDCHGPAGVSENTDVPTIAGIPEFVHSDALYIYRDEERPCASSAFRHGDTSRPETTMCAVVADLDDDTIDAVAAHYAELPFVPAKQEFDAALAATGKAIHEEHCDKCHSDGGSNPDDEASILAGQWMGYLETTFAQYAADERDQPSSMRDKMEALSDADEAALIHYYASQQ